MGRLRYLSGKLPDDCGAMTVDGIVYLGEMSSQKVNFPNVFAGLSALLPLEQQGQLQQYYKEPQVSAAHKMQRLLAQFPAGVVAVLMDNFEDKLDAESRTITDTELLEVLEVLLTGALHGVKVILTTRVVIICIRWTAATPKAVWQKRKKRHC